MTTTHAPFQTTLIALILPLLIVGCGDGKMRNRIHALDDPTLLEIVNNYTPDSTAGRLVREEIARRGISPATPAKAEKAAPINRQSPAAHRPSPQVAENAHGNPSSSAARHDEPKRLFDEEHHESIDASWRRYSVPELLSRLSAADANKQASAIMELASRAQHTREQCIPLLKKLDVPPKSKAKDLVEASKYIMQPLGDGSLGSFAMILLGDTVRRGLCQMASSTNLRHRCTGLTALGWHTMLTVKPMESPSPYLDLSNVKVVDPGIDEAIGIIQDSMTNGSIRVRRAATIAALAMTTRHDVMPAADRLKPGLQSLRSDKDPIIRGLAGNCFGEATVAAGRAAKIWEKDNQQFRRSEWALDSAEWYSIDSH